jgi:hypothetical protein
MKEDDEKQNSQIKKILKLHREGVQHYTRKQEKEEATSSV